MYKIYKETLDKPEVLRDGTYGIKSNEPIEDLRKRVQKIIDLSRSLLKDYEQWVEEKRALLSPGELCTIYDEYIMYCAGLQSYCEAVKDPYYFSEYKHAEEAIGDEGKPGKTSQKDKELFAKSCTAKLDAIYKELQELIGVLKSNRRMLK